MGTRPAIETWLEEDHASLDSRGWYALALGEDRLSFGPFLTENEAMAAVEEDENPAPDLLAEVETLRARLAALLQAAESLAWKLNHNEGPPGDYSGPARITREDITARNLAGAAAIAKAGE